MAHAVLCEINTETLKKAIAEGKAVLQPTGYYKYKLNSTYYYYYFEDIMTEQMASGLTEYEYDRLDKAMLELIYEAQYKYQNTLGKSSDKTQQTQQNIENQASDEQKEEEAQKIMADLVSGRQADIQKGMDNFKKMLDLVNDKFCNGRPIYTMYFRMITTDEIVLVDTTSTDWYHNNLISFTHKMNGSGEANTFTLDILFKPDDRNIKSINTLEQNLLAACAIVNKQNKLKTEGELYNNCIFQYGYGDNVTLRSPLYRATIMDYDSKIENGNLRYTITGYDGLYSAKEYRISPKSEYLTDANGAEIVDPMSYIARIFEIEFGKNNYYDVKFINIDKNLVSYPGDEWKQFEQKNIFQVVSDILAGCMTLDQYTAMSGTSGDENFMGPSEARKTFLPNQKQIFNYFLDNKMNNEGEGGKYGTVYIYKMESIYGEENKFTEDTIKPHIEMPFSWFAPTSNAYNHIVKDWHPQYNGSVLIALATTYTMGGNKYYTMSDEGELINVTGLGAARNGVRGDDIDQDMILSTIQEYNNWAFVTQYPYKANMTIIGTPCETPMTGKIRVIARIGNEEHHSSGVYMILGKTDKISSSGFYTELELFKFVNGFDPDYTKVVDDTVTEEDTESISKWFSPTFDKKDKNKDGILDINDGLGPINPVTKDEYNKNSQNQFPIQSNVLWKK